MRGILITKKKKKHQKPQTSQNKWKNNPDLSTSALWKSNIEGGQIPVVSDYKMHYIVCICVYIYINSLFCVFHPSFIWFTLCCARATLFFPGCLCHFSTTGACTENEPIAVMVHRSCWLFALLDLLLFLLSTQKAAPCIKYTRDASRKLFPNLLQPFTVGFLWVCACVDILSLFVMAIHFPAISP